MSDKSKRADHPQESCVDCGHDSDCATHNEPALPAGPCNCSKLSIGPSEDGRWRHANGRLATDDEAAQAIWGRSPDEYTGIVINDEGTTLPPGATVNVIIETSDWDDFEEKLAYLTAVELPGLEDVRISDPNYPVGYGYVFASRLSKDSKLFIQVKAPSEKRVVPAVDPTVTRAKEVLARVLDA